MTTVEDLIDAIPEDANSVDLVDDRKRDGVAADRDTLAEEMHVVYDRHKGPFSRPELVREMFGVVNGLALATDTEIEFEDISDDVPGGLNAVLVKVPEIGSSITMADGRPSDFNL